HVRDDRQGDLLLELMQDGPDLRVGPDAKVFVESVIDAGVQVPGQPELPEHFSEGVSMEVAERDERFGGKLLLHRPSPSLRGPRVDGSPALAKQSLEHRGEAVRPALEEGSETVEGEPAETTKVRPGDDDPRGSRSGSHGFARDATR